jgi:hypothetical protein
MQQSQTYIDILNNCRIDATTPIPDDNIYLVIQNKTIGSTGNFVSIVGQAKSGKSNFIAAIIAAGISKKEIFSICVLTYEHHQKTRICYFDTEQGSYDWQFKASIIKQLSKKSNIYEKLDVFTVREFSSKQILFLIKLYLENTPTCAVLIIDGLLDCIDNMNNEIEAKIVIKKIRKMAKDFDVLIISALHLSKKDKMTIGHIGSSSDRYAQSTLEVEKTKENTMILAPKLLRSAGWFDPIEIEYNEHTKKLVHLNP